MLLPKTKLAISNLSVSSPGSNSETKYEKILDAAHFANHMHENCSFIRLNYAFRKTLLKAAAKNTLRQRAMRAKLSLIPALISN